MNDGRLDESTFDFEDTPPLIIVNNQVERPLTKRAATLDVQVLGTQILRLCVDDDLLEQGVQNCMKEASTLEEVKVKMLHDMTHLTTSSNVKESLNSSYC